MSLKTFEKAAIADIQTLIHKILPDTKHLLDISLKVVNGLKSFTDSGAADIIVALIPGTVDDVLLSKLRQYLPEVITELKLADDEAGKSADQIIKDGATAIQTLTPAAKSIMLQGAFQLLGNKITSVSLPELQKIGQAYYEATVTSAA